MKGYKTLSIKSEHSTKTQFELFPSKHWLYYRTALHLLALAVTLYCAWYEPIALAAVAVLVFSWYWTRPTLIGQMQLLDDGTWQLTDHKKKQHIANLQNDSWLHPLACALHFKLGTGRALTLTILPDAMSKEDFRHLRIAIKLAA